MGRRKPKIIEQIRISGIADRGKSVGRDANGEVYFIEGAVPGDLIDAIIFKKKKGVGQGSVYRMLEESEDRVSAFCKHFSICGGCKWQHLSYERQLLEKERVVEDALRRIAKQTPLEKLPIIGASRETHYRNKMEYTFSTRRWVPKEELDTDEEVSFGPAVGFHKAGSFDKVVEVETCHLQDDYGNQIRSFIQDYALDNSWPFYNIREHHGIMRNLILRNNRNDEWMVNVIIGEKPKNWDAFLNSLQLKFDKIKSLWYTVNSKLNDTILDLEINHFHGDRYLLEDLGGVKFKIGPKSFFQTNSYQANNLYKEASDFAELNGSEIVYDLYTGLGSIALYLADKCKHVVGIEQVPEAIEDAKENMILNKITNASFFAADVKDILTDDFAKTHGLPDVVFTDPPRAGMHKDVVDMLLKLKAPKIVYISCNPATQARDIQLLSESYDLEKSRAVDMFPHTHHIENVVLLKFRHEKN